MFTGSLPTYHSRVQELRLRPLRAMLFHSKEGGAGQSRFGRHHHRGISLDSAVYIKHLQFCRREYLSIIKPYKHKQPCCFAPSQSRGPLLQEKFCLEPWKPRSRLFVPVTCGEAYWRATQEVSAAFCRLWDYLTCGRFRLSGWRLISVPCVRYCTLLGEDTLAYGGVWSTYTAGPL